jgi:hypothetical protein
VVQEIFIGKTLRKNRWKRIGLKRWDLLEKRQQKMNELVAERVELHNKRGCDNLRNYLLKWGVEFITVCDPLFVGSGAMAYLFVLPRPTIFKNVPPNVTRALTQIPRRRKSWNNQPEGFAIILRSNRISSWVEDFAHEIGHLHLLALTGEIGVQFFSPPYMEDFAVRFGTILSQQPNFRRQAREILCEMRRKNNFLDFLNRGFS